MYSLFLLSPRLFGLSKSLTILVFMNLSNYFSGRVNDFESRQRDLSVQSKTFTWIRTVVFILLVVAVYKSTYYTIGILTATVAVGSAIFFLIVVFHSNVEEKVKHCRELIKINRQEIDRLRGEFSPEHEGSKYVDRNHPFSYDLDLFGPDSIFQQIDRGRIPHSRDLLAKWMLNPAPRDQVVQRQGAISELIKDIDWVQEFEASIRWGKDAHEISPDLVAAVKNQAIVLLAGVLSFSATVLFFGWAFSLIPVSYLLLSILVNATFLYTHQYRLKKQSININNVMSAFELYMKPFRKIRSLKAGESAFLKEIRSAIDRVAISELRKLNRLVYLQDSRLNMLYWMINVILLLDIYTFISLQKWISRNKDQFEKWKEAVHKMEALSGMAMFTFVNPGYTFPEVMDGDNILRGKNVKHPLIPEKESVPNDFELRNEKLFLITGSNMSGKSTFLRTIGINVLMSWVGLPVNAEHFRCSSFEIFCSMRTQDNLAESTSSFYAELKRIKRLFELIDEQNRPVLFFLDEVLKGTNSHDRHTGARGIIDRLIKTNSFGFISTHDLELSDEFANETRIGNYSFNSTIQNGELLFDYKLTPGKCNSSNATELMKEMGIL